MPPAGLREGAVEANGMRLRYLDAGQGLSLVHVQPPGEWGFTRAHEALAPHVRLIVAELPGVGESAVSALAVLLTALGVERFNLLGTRTATETALGLALLVPDRVEAMILEAPSPPVADGLDRRADDLVAQLPRLVVPTLVLSGTRELSGAHRGAGGAARFYTERIPNCHLVFVYDAGAAIGDDRPEAFAEVVADFIARRDAFVISRAQTVIHP